MSQLRSVLDEMFAVDDGDLTFEELDADLEELTHVGQMVEVLRARKVKNLTDRGGHRDLGYSSPTAYLTDRSRVTPGHARQMITLANAVEKAPHAHAAWADERLSTDQARHLFRAAETVPDAYPEADEKAGGRRSTDREKSIWRPR